MGRPEGILFDLWATLITSEGFDREKGNAVLLACCENPHRVSLSQITALGDRVVSQLESREDQVALEYTQISLMRLLFDSFGLIPLRSLEEMEWLFWQASFQVRLLDGVCQMLEGLSSRGIAVGVVSNSSFCGETLRSELGRQGILGAFQFVISSADYGVRKPDPLIFETALRRLGTDARYTWFIGDHLEYDIQGARRAGLFPIAYDPREPFPSLSPAQGVIAHWSQLTGLVDSAR